MAGLEGNQRATVATTSSASQTVATTCTACQTDATTSSASQTNDTTFSSSQTDDTQQPQPPKKKPRRRLCRRQRRRVRKRLCRQPKTHISHLCQDTLEIIFGFLTDTSDKGRASQVCSAWREAAFNSSVWRGVEAQLRLGEGSRITGHVFPWSCLRRRRIRSVRLIDPRMPAVHDLLYEMPETTALRFNDCDTEINLCVALVTLKSRHLQSLDLSGCELIDHALENVSRGLKQLKHLNLSRCRLITDGGIKYVAGAQLNLEVLIMASCGVGITDLSLWHVSSGLKKLHTIDISGCDKITDGGLRYLARMKSLKQLNLSNRQDISSNALAHLVAGGSMLQTLRLDNCVSVKNSGLFCLGKLPGLRELSLRQCRISDVGLAYLSRAECRVEKLDLSFCDLVSDIGLGYLAGIKGLQRLDLTGCSRVTSAGLGYLRKTSLCCLTLKNCRLVSEAGLYRIASTLFGLRTLRLELCHMNETGLALAACNLLELQIFEVSDLDRLTDIRKIRETPSIMRLVTTLSVWTSRAPAPPLPSIASTIGSGADVSPLPLPSPISLLSTQILSMIFALLDVPDKGRAAQVCTTWRNSCYHPSVWSDDEVRLRLISQSRLDQTPWVSLASRGVRRVRAYSCNLWGLRHLIRGLPDLQALNIPVHLHHPDLLTRFFAFKLPRLTELCLEYCDTIRDDCIELISENLPNLVCLEMPGAILLTDASLLAVARLVKLKRLAITQCRNITDVGVGYLEMPLLTSLVLRNGNRLTDQALLHLSVNMPNLESLDLGNCIQLTLFVESENANPTVNNHNHHNYAVRSRKLTVNGCLARLYKLRRLCLSGCIAVGDSGLETMVGSTVAELGLEACVRVTDVGLRHLARLSNLHTLDLSFNDRISDEGIKLLSRGGESPIESLNLRCCDGLSEKTLLVVSRGFRKLHSLTVDRRHSSNEGLYVFGQAFGHRLRAFRVGGFNRIDEIRMTRLHGLLRGIGVVVKNKDSKCFD